jgi:hypothetical protein
LWNIGASSAARGEEAAAALLWMDREYEELTKERRKKIEML